LVKRQPGMLPTLESAMKRWIVDIFVLARNGLRRVLD
jgi:hypothetical protein